MAPVRLRHLVYDRLQFLLSYHFPPGVAINFPHGLRGTCKVALLDKMAAPTQSRRSDPAAAPTTTLPQGKAPSLGAVVSVRLWIPGEAAEPGQGIWLSNAPLVCLAIDLIVASGGDPGESKGEILVAGFSGFLTAIAAARRLQWAVQGFGEAENLRTAAAAILVRGEDELIGNSGRDSLLNALDRANPGQILISEAGCKAIDDLPGFPTKTVAGAGVRELIWRAPENQSTRAFDEQTLGRIMEQRGLESHLSAGSEALASHADGDATRDKAQSSDPARGARHGAGKAGREKLPWLIGVAAVVIVAFAAILGVRLFGGGTPKPVESAQSPSPEPAAPVSTPSAPPATHAAHPVQTAHAEPPPRTEPARKQPVHEPIPTPARVEKAEEAPKPPAPSARPPETQGGRCDLDRTQLPQEIEQAQKSLARGKYRDAQRQFGAVLACEPGNSSAREGLERVRSAIAAGGSPQ